MHFVNIATAALLFAAEPLPSMEMPALGFALEPHRGDLVILPFGEGMAYPAEADIPIDAPHLRFSNGMQLSMGFFGRFRSGEWTMFGVADTLDAGLDFSNVIAIEAAEGEVAQTYANIIAVKEGNENSPKTQALVKVLLSQSVKDFIAEKYQGQVVAIF